MNCLICSCGIAARTQDLAPDMRRHQGRGLCDLCYSKARYHGTLNEYPRIRDPDHWWENVLVLIKTGVHPENWAKRLDTTNVALARRLYRAGMHEYASAIERIVGMKRRNG